MADLVIKDLHVSVENKEILKGLSLTVKSGERHALMGPNGMVSLHCLQPLWVIQNIQLHLVRLH